MSKLDESLAALERVAPFVPSPVTLAEADAKEKAGKTPRGVGIVTDALVGVGNFLGRNPALVQDIAAQQLDISRRQLEVQQQLLAEFRSRWNARDTLEVPGL